MPNPAHLPCHVVSLSGSAGPRNVCDAPELKRRWEKESNGETRHKGGGRWVCTKATSPGSSHCSSERNGSPIGCSTTNLASRKASSRASVENCCLKVLRAMSPVLGWCGRVAPPVVSRPRRQRHASRCLLRPMSTHRQRPPCRHWSWVHRRGRGHRAQQHLWCRPRPCGGSTC